MAAKSFTVDFMQIVYNEKMNVKHQVGLSYYGTWISLDANDYFASYFTYKGKHELCSKNVDLWVSSGLMTIKIIVIHTRNEKKPFIDRCYAICSIY